VRYGERVQLRQVEHVDVGIVASVGSPSLGLAVECLQERTIGWDIVVAMPPEESGVWIWVGDVVRAMEIGAIEGVVGVDGM